MKNILHSFFAGIFCLSMALTAHATDYTGAAPESGKSYYIYNVATKQFLAEGDNYGTHASITEVGTPLKLATNNEGFSVRTQFGSNYMSKATNGVWMDQSTATEWRFNLVAGTTNQYTIGLGTENGYLQCSDGKTKVTAAAMPETAELAHWILVPVTELDSRMNEATYSNPVEATHILNNSRFDVSYNGTGTWAGDGVTIEGYRADVTGINGGNYVANVKDKEFDSYYEISKKAGIYKLVAQGNHYSKNDANSIDAQLYIGDSYVTLPNATSGTLSTTAKEIANGEYMVEAQMYSSLTTKIKIGFRKEGTNTGDITMIDNIRLYYYGNELEDHQAFLIDLQKTANELKSLKTAADVAADLNTQIEAYASTDTTKKANCVSFAKKVVKAISATKYSAKVLEKLNTEIQAAESALAGGNGVDALQASIDSAKTVYNNAATNKIAVEVVKYLKNAVTDYMFANASGTAPTVKTDPRFARGGTMAFGRMTVSGVATNQIIEQGFCYATHDNPTYNDMRTTDYLNQSGKVYWLKNLTPGTIYYMRAYAITKTYAIGYGDVVKVITIPKGNVNYTMNAGWPDAATEARVKAACEQSKQLWNDLTSINGYHSTVNYGSGTPTADCSYGGWVRVGPNSSYQRTGTMLHEWLHGVGVGTHYATWRNPALRKDGERGNWLGDRANEVLRFWDNNNSSVLTGDGTHMWPYGVNGAHEDTGAETLYIGLSLILQGLCEDGLIPTGKFCLPAYTLPVDNDDTKYYIKSESTSHGLFTSYLFVNSDGSLSWKQASSATVNDSCAWTISFTPNNAYYQMKNVATGRYLTYSSSKFTTTERTKPTSADNLHLMKGRVNIADVNGLRGYWIIRPEGTSNPATLTATANGGVGSSTFNLGNEAVAQRWIISTIEESGEMGEQFTKLALEELENKIENVRSLLATPHTENTADLDAMIETEIANVESAKAACKNSEDVAKLTQQIQNAGFTFLGLATPSDPAQPFDITFMLSNPGMDGTDGWNFASAPGINYSCAEYYQATFDINQTISGLPRGTYKMCVQGFQRPGTTADSYSNYNNGNKTVTTQVYAGTAKADIKHIIDGKSGTKLGGTESSVGSDFVPNNMQAASLYFAKDKYENEVTAELTAAKNNLKIGIKCTSAPTSYWSIFDDFRLYSLGGKATNEETGITEVGNNVQLVGTQYFSLNGTVLNAPQKGINILRQTYSDGKVTVKKVFVK